MVPVLKNRNRLPNWFDDFFGDDLMTGWNKQFATPSVNIIENENCFRIEVAAPGMTRENFRVCVDEGNELVVALEKSSDGTGHDKPKDEHKPEKDTYLRREFSYGSFRRSFILPENVDRSKIAATMKNGVLTVDLPKREESKQTPAVREIAIG